MKREMTTKNGRDNTSIECTKTDYRECAEVTKREVNKSRTAEMEMLRPSGKLNRLPGLNSKEKGKKHKNNFVRHDTVGMTRCVCLI